jgi:hypothetical protein
VGAEDAPYLVRELRHEFTELDLQQLPNYSIYITLMIDGAPSKPFSATTLFSPTDLAKPRALSQ